MSYQKELRETEFAQIGPWSSEQYNFQNVHLLFKHPVGRVTLALYVIILIFSST